MSPYPVHPMDPNDPDYDPKLDPHNSQYDPNDPRLVGGVSPYVKSKPLSTEEANQYLTNRRAKQSGDNNAIMSTDEANQYLQQRRAQQSTTTPQASIEAPTQETAQQPTPKESYPQGVGLATLFHDLPPSLQQMIREHPYMAGAAAAGAIPLAMLLPEGAVAAAAGYGLRNLITPAIRYGAGAAGVGAVGDWLTGGQMHETILPRLIEAISRLGEEGGQ